MTQKEGRASNLADPLLLEKIDKLFACGVGEHVPLPQLVVLGDQSSGKSSVLEGLTRLPFPRNSGLCTRFATQITFRRAPEVNISVSVIPGPKADPDHAAKVKEWKKPDLKELNPDAFAAIMEEVHEVMGLSKLQSAGEGGAFSEDVLKLDISGPNEEHFSVVDVPGIFKKRTEGVTNHKDMAMVRDMVRSYMVNPRSVILAITPANQDIATQEILEMATDADPDGERTLGVLTKPDLIDQGAEHPVVELLQGKRHTLKLGWCMVKNLGQKELDAGTADRNALERTYFHSTSPWKELDHDRLGVDALRVRLKEVLADTIRRTFQTVRQEILKQLHEARKELHDLGAERQSPEQQREYLMNASMRYDRLVRDALSGNYGRDDWFDKHDTHKLATAVVTRNDSFSKATEEYGYSYFFDDPEPRPKAVPVSASYSLASSDLDEKDIPTITVREQPDDPDLQEVVYSEVEVDATVKEGITDWLMRVYEKSRGFELGTFEGHILATTMKAQSKRWEALGLGYISDIISLTHDFIKRLLKVVLPDPKMRRVVLDKLIDGLLTSYRAAYERAEFLLDIERAGTPTTINHYFNDTLQKLRQDRFKKLMEPHATSANLSTDAYGPKQMVVRLDDLSESHPMANREHTVGDIKDILQSYYQVARKRFVDTMCMQAAGHFLIHGGNSPLLHFSPNFVSKLSEEELDLIAGEDANVRRNRKSLQKLVGELEAGRKIVM